MSFIFISRWLSVRPAANHLNHDTDTNGEMLLQQERQCMYARSIQARLPNHFYLNTLRTGAFKLFKCTFPGSKQFKSTFIMCFFKYL